MLVTVGDLPYLQSRLWVDSILRRDNKVFTVRRKGDTLGSPLDIVQLLEKLPRLEVQQENISLGSHGSSQRFICTPSN